jgi:TM2 domain-containing membrane protein YozV
VTTSENPSAKPNKVTSISAASSSIVNNPIKEFNETVSKKDWLVTFIICWIVGFLGVHRFYSGHLGIGIMQLITLGGCGIWTLIDLALLMTGNFKDGKGKPITRVGIDNTHVS